MNTPSQWWVCLDVVSKTKLEWIWAKIIRKIQIIDIQGGVNDMHYKVGIMYQWFVFFSFNLLCSPDQQPILKLKSNFYLFWLIRTSFTRLVCLFVLFLVKSKQSNLILKIEYGWNLWPKVSFIIFFFLEKGTPATFI